ncbi:CpaF family protein [Candidatus Margulisiibacteriota bacterium]
MKLINRLAREQSFYSNQEKVEHLSEEISDAVTQIEHTHESPSSSLPISSFLYTTEKDILEAKKTIAFVVRTHQHIVSHTKDSNSTSQLYTGNIKTHKHYREFERQAIHEVQQHFSDQSRDYKNKIVALILDEIFGLGPLQRLLSISDISEIMVNGPDMIFIEYQGKIYRTNIVFADDPHIKRIINRIIGPLGRHLDESQPMVDARLHDGSRINAIIHPLSLAGSIFTIRKFPTNPFAIHDLLSIDALTQPMADFIEACVKAKLNIVISGGTGTGKTTLLNVVSSFIPDDERIITIEDAAELQLRQDHTVSLETRTANTEGVGTVTIRDLVYNALRMRPDRIIVGEVRGGEALDMLQAMNTGHEGSITTCHANSPEDALSRIKTMVHMAGFDISDSSIDRQIRSALNVVIHTSRLPDGSRKIVSIHEVIGDRLIPIFRYVFSGYDDSHRCTGSFISTGFIPTFIERLCSYNPHFSESLFKQTSQDMLFKTFTVS